jgi:NAD(P)-dependent dehydrogenase (short-subunit alcohol dehydrogenase family)
VASAPPCEAATRLGGLDILVNNAGVTATVPLLDLEESDWDRILDTNLKGAFLVGQAAARLMRGNGGAIINVASILGERVAGQLAPYAASKAGLLQLTRAMALEWARHGIRVNALCPGYIETDLIRAFFQSDEGQAMTAASATPAWPARGLDGALLLAGRPSGRLHDRQRDQRSTVAISFRPCEGSDGFLISPVLDDLRRIAPS